MINSTAETRAIAALTSLYVVRMLGLFMVLPVISLAGDLYQGSTIFLLGIALGIYGLTQACLQILYGVLSDRFGRKPLIIIGLLVFALGSYVAASADTVWGLIIGRALQGAGAIAGVIMATVGDLTSEDKRTKAMATIGISIGITFSLSLVMGPFIASLFDVRALFVMTILLSFIGILIVCWWVPTVPRSDWRHVSLSRFIQVFNAPELLRLNAGVFILHMVLTALFIAFPLSLEAIGFPRVQQAWLYLVLMTFAFLLMVPLIVISEKKKVFKPMFLIVLTMMIFALSTMAWFDHHWLILVSLMLLFFIGFNFLEAMLPSLMTRNLPKSLRGAGSGLFASCQFLGAACGGFMGGWLFEHWGAIAVFLFAAALCFFWLLLILPVPHLIGGQKLSDSLGS